MHLYAFYRNHQPEDDSEHRSQLTPGISMEIRALDGCSTEPWRKICWYSFRRKSIPQAHSSKGRVSQDFGFFLCSLIYSFLPAEQHLSLLGHTLTLRSRHPVESLKWSRRPTVSSSRVLPVYAFLYRVSFHSPYYLFMGWNSPSSTRIPVPGHMNVDPFLAQ